MQRSTGCAVSFALMAIQLQYWGWSKDYSMQGHLRWNRDAHYTYEITSEFLHMNRCETYQFHVMMRKTETDQLLIYFETALMTKGGDPDGLSDADQEAFRLPYIVITRETEDIPRTIITYPNETKLSLTVKSELAMMMARNFSHELNLYATIPVEPSYFVFYKHVEDTPLGRNCRKMHFFVSAYNRAGKYTVAGHTNHEMCQESFAISSVYKPTGYSTYDVRWTFDQKRFALLGLESYLQLVLAEDQTKQIRVNQKLTFKDYVAKKRHFDENDIKKRWAGVAEIFGFIRGAC